MTMVVLIVVFIMEMLVAVITVTMLPGGYTEVNDDYDYFENLEAMLKLKANWRFFSSVRCSDPIICNSNQIIIAIVIGSNNDCKDDDDGDYPELTCQGPA